MKKMIPVDDIRKTLNTGLYGDYLSDYRNTNYYFADAISEIAKFHSVILHYQESTFYAMIEKDLWENLHDSLYLSALDFIQYDLNQNEISTELIDMIETSLTAIEFLACMNEIPDMILKYFAEE